MRAVLLNPPGGVGENMVVTDVADPAPGPCDAIVAVEYAGCNFADTMMRRGIYPHPKGYPLVAGLELAGRVVAVGKGGHGRSGRATAWQASPRMQARSRSSAPFPPSASRCCPTQSGFDTAAAFFVQALTAWHLMHTVSKTNKGDCVLVHAIGGGVGLYLTQVGVAAGATIIGTIGTAGKEKRALAYGASKVINREEEDFVAAVNEFTRGVGVDKVVDSTGGSILDRSFDTIKLLGHVVSYGEAEAKALRQSVGAPGAQVAHLHAACTLAISIAAPRLGKTARRLSWPRSPTAPCRCRSRACSRSTTCTPCMKSWNRGRSPASCC